MPLIDWDDLDLCSTDDVHEEIRELNIPLQASRSADVEAIIAVKIRKAKDLMRQELKILLPSFFVTANGGSAYTYGEFASWYSQARGYRYADLDDILDKLYNPTELKHAAVALTIVLALEDGALRDNALWQRNNELIDKQLAYWKGQYALRFETAVKLLQIDLDESGDISDFERARTHSNQLWRV